MRRSPLLKLLSWLLGLSLLGWLLHRHGVQDLAAALVAGGWPLLLVPAFALLPLACHATGWRQLIPSTQKPSWRRVFLLRWISGTVKDLLPVAKVGGDLLRAALLRREGTPLAPASASVAADVTAGISTQLAFAVLGVALLLQRPEAGSALPAILTGILLFALALAAFFLLQRRGLFQRMASATGRLGGRDTRAAMRAEGAAIDAALRGIYAERAVFLRATGWRFSGWFLGAGEIWLALLLLGAPVGPLVAIVLESLVQFLRSAAFMVPGAIGVQEGALVMLGAIFGLPPDVSLALAAVKRGRELLLGAPALLLLAWLYRRRQPETGSAAGPSTAERA